MIRRLEVHDLRSGDGNGRARGQEKATAWPQCQQVTSCTPHTVIRLPQASQR